MLSILSGDHGHLYAATTPAFRAAAQPSSSAAWPAGAHGSYMLRAQPPTMPALPANLVAAARGEQRGPGRPGCRTRVRFGRAARALCLPCFWQTLRAVMHCHDLCDCEGYNEISCKRREFWCRPRRKCTSNFAGGGGWAHLPKTAANVAFGPPLRSPGIKRRGNKGNQCSRNCAPCLHPSRPRLSIQASAECVQWPL